MSDITFPAVHETVFENSSQRFQITYYNDLAGSLKFDILLYGVNVLIHLGNVTYNVTPLNHCSTLSDLFELIHCKWGAIEITSNRKLNSIIDAVLGVPMCASFPISMKIYTSNYLAQSLAIGKLPSLTIEEHHIAVSVANYALASLE
jgi:hypothetical protein